MGPNGDDRTILGRKSNHVRFFFFHTWLFSIYRLFSPHIYPRLKMALQNTIFLCQVQHELAPVSHQTPFMGELHLLDALVLTHDDEPWQPGDYLVPARNDPPQPDIQSLLSQMQNAITT